MGGFRSSHETLCACLVGWGSPLPHPKVKAMLAHFPPHLFQHSSMAQGELWSLTRACAR
jgi:hypothetical protein